MVSVVPPAVFSSAATAMVQGMAVAIHFALTMLYLCGGMDAGTALIVLRELALTFTVSLISWKRRTRSCGLKTKPFARKKERE